MTVHRPPSVKPGSAVLLIFAGAVAAVGSVFFGSTATLIAFGVPLAGAAALYLVRRPLATLVVMVVIEVTNLNGVTTGHSPVPVFYLSLGLGLVSLGIALTKPALRRRFNKVTLLCMALISCYLLTQWLAAIGSQNIDHSMATLQTEVAGCIFLTVVLLLAQMTGRPWVVAGAFAVPMAVISVLCLISEVAFGGAATFGGFAVATTASGELITTLRFGGPGLDSNFWGRNLVLAVPVAAALLLRAVRSGRRWPAVGWVSCLLALLIGVYLTQSRGTMIATAVVLVIWVIASGPGVRRAGLMSLPVVALVLLLPGIGNRMVAVLGDVSNARPSPHVDPSVLGRLAAQEASWAMFRDRPIFGFGPGEFLNEMFRYTGTVPTAVLHPTDAPHNLYAQLTAETGIVGLVGWLIFVGGFVAILIVQIVRLSGVPTGSDRSLAAALLAAIIGWSVASIFLHLATFRTFAIVLALAGALASSPWPVANPVSWRRRRGVRRWLAATMCGVAASAVVLAASASTTYTVSQKVTLLPTEHDSPWDYAYALDIRSRGVLLPTYAGLMAADAREFKAVPDTVRGVITISVTDAEEGAARAGLDRALVTARARLSQYGADSSYVMAPVGEVGMRAQSGWSVGRSAIAVIVGVIVGLTTALAIRRRRSDAGLEGGASGDRESGPGRPDAGHQAQQPPVLTPPPR